MSFNVKVKWGKEVFPDIELQTSESPMVFKAQIFALTGVQPHRQKIMVKGTTVKDESWDGAKLKNGSLVLMMGSKDEDVPQEPISKPTFLEDMSEAEVNSAFELPVGIKNLGNTCYLNAVLQSLKSVPEIHDSIKSFKIKSDGATLGFPMLTVAIQDLFRVMDAGKTAIPLVLVDLFRSTFPRFAEQGEGGKYIQQDASECWTELLRLLQDVLESKTGESACKKFSSSLIEQFFSGEFICTWTCDENEEEKNVTFDKFQQLSCHISQDVLYLHAGLVTRMTEQVTKRCEKLDRDALYTKISKITRLPAYLCIEMVRFFYKEKKMVNAKILKDVKFPLVLDTFELCSSELQQKLLPMREKHKLMDEQIADEEKILKRGRVIPKDQQKKKQSFPSSFESDAGSNNSGFYHLQAVVTHQGRTSSSGHYVAWVRYKAKEWLKCDDDDITPVTEEEILRLSGGGDWHTAYLLLYGPHKLEIAEEEDENAETKVAISEEKAMETD